MEQGSETQEQNLAKDDEQQKIIEKEHQKIRTEQQLENQQYRLKGSV